MAMTARAYPFRTTEGLEVDPECAMWRHQKPVARVLLPYGGEGWLVTRYEDVKTVLSDRRFGRAALVGRDVPRTTPRIQRVATILTMDPPDHTRLRRLVAAAFVPRRIEALRPRARQLAEESVSAMAAAGPPGDLVEALARPLPSRMIGELLGVPYEDRARFFTWADAVLSTAPDDQSAIVRTFAELQEYLAVLVARHRAEPADDLLGALVTARDEGDRLTEDELVGFAITLLLAGLETTANQIGNFWYRLLAEPAGLAELRRHPDRVPAAVEELLRYTPIAASAGFTRIALEDVELGGVLVRTGEAVLVDLDSANRDESMFADPDELRLDRTANPHVAFGYGAHFCIGSHLARLELQVAVGVVLERLPSLRFAVPPDDLEWHRDRSVRGLRALPVTW
jgi:cytochrome P450